MHGRPIPEDRATYVNPVYPKSFPDPFVLKHRGQYYGYCTGFEAGGLVFGIIRSRDLVSWTEIGGAMEPLADSPPFYWAPEVTYDNGKFYLYYSAGNETLMHLRVAVSDRPDGGFIDSGRVLTSVEFAIDAHVFTDDDGSRYMFYATDFLEHTHIGTGTVVDRMIDWFTLEGDPKPVTRAKYDWQVYDPQRHEKGGVRWHTVEGPAVIKRKGRYFEMFSGGNWQNTTYGVSFAVAGDLAGNEEWKQFSDGEKVLPILRTLPGAVVGPGHNSVIRGPNNRELYCVYHAWQNDQRVASIDRMDFASDRIFVIGPTFTPQIRPYRPSIEDLFPDEPLFGEAVSAGRWRRTDCGIESSISDACERVYPTEPYFLCEFSFRCTEWNGENASFGFSLIGPGGNAVEFQIGPGRRSGSMTIRSDAGESVESFFLPLDFILPADHLMKIEAAGGEINVSIDAAAVSFQIPFPSPVHSLALRSRKSVVEFSALTVTEGFEETFDSVDPRPLAGGWQAGGSQDSSPIRYGGELIIKSGAESYVTKGGSVSEFEFAANLRALGGMSDNSEYGLQLLDDDGTTVARFGISGRSEAFLEIEDNLPSRGSIDLPPRSDERHRQLRLIQTGGKLTAMIEDFVVAALKTRDRTVRGAVYCRGMELGIEMVRMTNI